VRERIADLAWITRALDGLAPRSPWLGVSLVRELRAIEAVSA
jgi:hypothetical protein